MGTLPMSYLPILLIRYIPGRAGGCALYTSLSDTHPEISRRARVVARVQGDENTGRWFADVVESSLRFNQIVLCNFWKIEKCR